MMLSTNLIHIIRARSFAYFDGDKQMCFFNRAESHHSSPSLYVIIVDSANLIERATPRASNNSRAEQQLNKFFAFIQKSYVLMVGALEQWLLMNILRNKGSRLNEVCVEPLNAADVITGG